MKWVKVELKKRLHSMIRKCNRSPSVKQDSCLKIGEICETMDNWIVWGLESKQQANYSFTVDLHKGWKAKLYTLCRYTALSREIK